MLVWVLLTFWFMCGVSVCSVLMFKDLVLGFYIGLKSLSLGVWSCVLGLISGVRCMIHVSLLSSFHLFLFRGLDTYILIYLDV